MSRNDLNKTGLKSLIEIEHLGHRVELSKRGIIHTAHIYAKEIHEMDTDPNLALVNAFGKLRTALGVAITFRNLDSPVWAQ